MRVELTAGRRLLGRQAGRIRSWRALAVGLAAFAAATFPTLSPAFGQASGVTYSFSPQSGPVGTEVRFSGRGCPNEPDVTRTGRFDIFRSVDGSTSGPVLGFANFRSEADGSFSGRIESLGDGPLGPHRTSVSCTGGNAATGDFTLTAAGPAVTSTTGPTGGTSGTGETTATTAVPSAIAGPTAAPSPAQPSLLSATGQPAATLPASALAATGSSRVDYWMRVAAASFMLGLLCMFITQRRRFQRIDAWLFYIFNSF